MPKLSPNHPLYGLSGKLGNVVLRQHHGKTIIQAAPTRKAPATAAELTNRELFKQAVAYAKQARQKPEVWGIYVAEAKRRGGTSNAFAVAVSDFRKGLGLVKAVQIVKLKERKGVLERPFVCFLFFSGQLLNTFSDYRQIILPSFEVQFDIGRKKHFSGWLPFSGCGA